METGDKSNNCGRSRQAEEAYLKHTLEVVSRNLANYSGEVARMQENIDEMLAHYHDNDVEVLTILNNTVTMHEHMKRALMRNEKAQNKPYFGRIIFRDGKTGKEESLYIGRGGIARDATHQVVVDWRAPVASAYYENNLGKCSYTAPGGVEIPIDLKRKRTYEIEGGKLLDFFDSEVIANDELLTKYLAKNRQAVLGEIVATIQKEQNEIIRKSPYHNVIVQGVAGSGKTTVAMHRISYILYNYAERFRPEDFYIVGSNRILLNYITGVLPDLDVYGVRQMTMEQLFVRLLYEDWDEKKYRIKATGKEESIKGSSRWFQDLAEYCRKLEWEAISRDTVCLNPKAFVEGFRDGKTGVYDETAGKKADRKDLICLLPGEAVEAYIRENPAVSIQNKINMLNERLLGKVKEEFLGKGISYSEAERKAILKACRGWYGERKWKDSIFKMYRDFLKKQIAKGIRVEFLTDEICLRINRGSGAIHYMTRDKKLLLAEREKECRQIEDGPNGKAKGRLYLEWQKKEVLYAPGNGGNVGVTLRGEARYISHGNGKPAVVISEQGYGMVLAADTAACCDIPAYGSYLYMENKGQMDFYFVVGKGKKEVEEACRRLVR